MNKTIFCGYGIYITDEIVATLLKNEIISGFDWAYNRYDALNAVEGLSVEEYGDECIGELQYCYIMPPVNLKRLKVLSKEFISNLEAIGIFIEEKDIKLIHKVKTNW